MRSTTFALAASLALALGSGAFAQTPAGGGSAEGNLNNPGSVKSNGEKAMERSTGSATGLPDTATGSTRTNPAMVPPGAGPAGTGMPPGTGGTAGGPGGINR
ncbi:hypothetical protein ASG40_11375 [Methylobacterium sp. Leaf399]|uniref:hypothetical protein n=1 Tax=Methylobacterium sp. Leaf399 TaxID=1736364 RepID=UPI0006F823D3|nr:hypothetical protein [Methylobacterium sp. Leaf399]KQT09225.1 hypothetical protein ASG40_11375 [Methylobacterium sp. Leaf399]